MAISVFDLDERQQEIARWLAANFPQDGDVPYPLTRVLALNSDQFNFARQSAGIAYGRGRQGRALRAFGVVNDGDFQREFVAFYRRTSDQQVAEVAEVFSQVGTPGGVTMRENSLILYPCISVVINLGNRRGGGFHPVTDLGID